MAKPAHSTGASRRATSPPIPPPYGRFAEVVDLFARELPRAYDKTEDELDRGATICFGAVSGMMTMRSQSYEELRAKVRVLRLCFDDAPLSLEQTIGSPTGAGLLESILLDLETI